ncbi:MAG: extracellular solute-binding protein [Clostridium celatum]|nr:extracellular solute-binding protein [Clostridium celatum]
MKTKKILGILLAASMSVSLVACGSNNDNASNEDDNKSVAADSEAKGEITYWSMWSNTEPQAKVIQEAIDAYTEETGIKVNVEWKGRDLGTVLQAALEAGEEIDFFDWDYQKIAYEYKDKVMSLEDMAETAGYNDYAAPVFPNAVRKWAGDLIAIPYQPYTSGIYYNKAMFEEAGITEDPQTWDEFLAACEKLKGIGVAPLAQDDAYVMYTFGYHLARYIGQDGVTDVVTNGNWAENEAVLKAAQDIVDLISNGYLSEYAPGAYPEGENEVGYEEAAMVVNASWVPAEITNNTNCDLEWGMFNYPSVNGGKDPNTIANVGAQGFAINKNSKNAQATFDLIMKITSGEFDQKMALDCTGIPSDTRNTEWPEDLQGTKVAFDALTDVYDWNMGLNENPDITETIQTNCLQLFEGKLTAQQFVDAMEKATN